MKLIAWDFDGVLNRGYPHGFDEWQRTFEVDLGVSAKDFTDFVYHERNFVTVITGQVDLMTLMADYVSTYDVPHTPRAVLDYWLTKDAFCDEQVLGWLQACSVPGVIATNNETHRARFIWEKLGYSKHMQHIFASGRMGVKKPDHGFFAQIEDWSGHAPGDILLIDDAEKNIAAAAERGWQVFHFTDATRHLLPEVLGVNPWTTIMIQGAGSNVGKSLIVAGLCRAARLRGLSVAPFKPQNMSNNAAVTVDGGEIGRAQALQALACGLQPHTDMNPVLLKPESEVGSQVVVQGRRVATVKARDYAALKPSLMAPVLESFGRLKAAHNLVIVEGAGSPAEVNLRKGDIANMGFAMAAGVPVVLVGDIDRGGVIAQMVGTQAVLDAADEALIKGFLINKFRGDPRLFDDGYRLIETRTGWRGLGVLPYFPEAWRLPAEDALDIAASTGTGTKIACLQLSRIANFDDLDPLKSEPGLQVVMVGPGQTIPTDAALVIIPGSKSTRADLAYIRAQGWDIDLLAHHRRGGRVLGICGGYQMLGMSVSDPEGIEGPAGDTPGLGLLNITTTMQADKRLTLTTGTHAATGEALTAYEIHIGRSSGPDTARPFAMTPEPEGATSPDGRVMGSYLHGMFSGDSFRAAFLRDLGLPSTLRNHGAEVEETLNALAAHIEAHFDVDALLALAK